MQLPGGAIINGHLERDFKFKALTGEIELILSEQLAQHNHQVYKVTEVLTAALDSIGESPVTRRIIEDLSVGDRQFLMRQLANMLNDKANWLTANCKNCDQAFDVSYKYSELPVKQASNQYPQIQLQSSLGALLVRVPCGRDQLAIARLTDEQLALDNLLLNIVTTASDNKKINPKELTESDRQLIEKSLEGAAPEVATELLAQCPYCQQENRISLEPYDCLSHQAEDLFNDLHHIAIHYHWDEKTILDMPRNRRKLYVKLIDRSRGMSSSLHQFEGGRA